jgi:hypothetical protein
MFAKFGRIYRSTLWSAVVNEVYKLIPSVHRSSLVNNHFEHTIEYRCFAYCGHCDNYLSLANTCGAFKAFKTSTHSGLYVGPLILTGIGLTNEPLNSDDECS